jgi:hypothetical protein
MRVNSFANAFGFAFLGCATLSIGIAFIPITAKKIKWRDIFIRAM